jgi:hypothetical protein
LAGHSPINEAAVLGLAGQVVPPLGKGKGFCWSRTAGTTGRSRCTE